MGADEITLRPRPHDLADGDLSGQIGDLWAKGGAGLPANPSRLRSTVTAAKARADRKVAGPLSV